MSRQSRVSSVTSGSGTRSSGGRVRPSGAVGKDGLEIYLLINQIIRLWEEDGKFASSEDMPRSTLTNEPVPSRSNLTYSSRGPHSHSNWRLPCAPGTIWGSGRSLTSIDSTKLKALANAAAVGWTAEWSSGGVPLRVLSSARFPLTRRCQGDLGSWKDSGSPGGWFGAMLISRPMGPLLYELWGALKVR
jgi:hypothetical protein